MDAPWKNDSSPGLTSQECEPLSFARLGAHCWAGSYPPLGPQPWSRVGAQRCLEPTQFHAYLGMVKYFTAIFSESWSNTPAGVAERTQASSGLGGRSSKSWVHWQPGQSLQATPTSRSHKQYGEGLAPESSRELVGFQKLMMAADVCKQPAGCLVMESTGSRSLSKVIISPESLPRSGLCWENEAAGALL